VVFAIEKFRSYLVSAKVIVSTTDPWYANIVNYIVAGYITPGADEKKIIRDSILHLWDDLYLYRVCAMAY
jgi:hypothetical protein